MNKPVRLGPKTPLRVLIYGAGAVGLGIASALLKAGAEVAVLGRRETVSRLRLEGLVRTGIFGEFMSPPQSFQAVSSLAELSGEPFDFLLVAVKSFDTEQAARDIHSHPHWRSRGGRIVLFQNGWGNGEIFLGFFDPKQIFSARVITGFMRPEKNRVEITVHAEPIHIGSIFGGRIETLDPLCAAITSGGIPCETTPEVAKDLWAKMLFNCPLNSLGAVCGVNYGALGESPWARSIMKRTISEIFPVMAAAGYSTHWHSAEEYLAFFYETLVPRTADHYSSTLQDLRLGKRTEIDALNGAVVALGKKAGLATPVNETLHALIRFLEMKQRGVEDASGNRE